MVNLTLDRNHEIIWLWLIVNSLSPNPIKWSNTLKQFVGNMPTNCLSVFDHFEGLALRGLIFCYGSSKIFTMSPNENDPDLFRGYFSRVPTEEKNWLLNNTSCFAGHFRKPPDGSIVLACENNHKFTIYLFSNQTSWKWLVYN